MNSFNHFLIVFQIIISFINVSIIYFSNTKEIYIDIDNYLYEYENNINFSNYSTDIKLIALYLPEINYDETNYNNSMKSNIIKKAQTTKHKKENNENLYYDHTDIDSLLKTINIAKSHGIYGFAIDYYWFRNKKILEKPLDLFLNNQNIKFNFMLIWKKNIWNYKDNIEKYNNHLVIKFIKDIKEYILDQRYIKINQKSVLGIYEPEPENLLHLKSTIIILKKKAIELGIGELFIIAFTKKNLFNSFSKLQLFEGIYEFPYAKTLFLDKNNYLNNRKIYEIINLKKEYLNFSLSLNNMILFSNKHNNTGTFCFNYFTPEHFYMINKLIINCNKIKKKSNERFLFIYDGDNFFDSELLRPNKQFGYALLNSLSKALFDLPYINNYNITNLKHSTKIAIQAHVYYENLIDDIIQKTNNIPVSFNLFISTDSESKKDNIKKYILRYSKAEKFEIKIFNNKGRDVLPLLIQLKQQIKKYKYFCHIHTKKSKHIDFGDEWRNYLFNNLLGNSEIISEILTDFENNKKLGLIFPEIYYKVLKKFGNNILGANLKYMEAIIKEIAPYLKLSTDNLDFPMGNMFWAKMKSVFQIFQKDFYRQIPNENEQLDGTLIHGIERIWIYLVKFNGYYYKKIFKHL